MKIFFKNNGVAILPLTLLISGLIIIISATIALTNYLLNYNSAVLKYSSEALAAAKSGIEDAIMKIIRNNNYSGSFTLTIGQANVNVTVLSNDPMAGKDTIISLAVVRSIQKKLKAIVNIDAMTTQVNIESIQEVAI